MKFLPVILAAILEIWIALACKAQTQSLSMQQAVSLALNQNPDLKIGQLEVNRSRQDRTIARSLYLPTVNAAAQVNHFFELTPFFGFGTYGEGDKIPYGRFGGEDQAVGMVFATQSLYNPIAGTSVKLARLKEEESKMALTDKQVDIAAQVKQIYLQILVLGKRVKLQQESIKRNQVALEDAKSLLAKGKAIRADTLRAFTSVKNLEPDLQRMNYAIETSKLQLKALLGLPSSQTVELTDSLVVPQAAEVPTETEVYELAKQNQPQLRIASLHEKIYEQQVRLSSGNLKPTVSAVGQYAIQTQTNQFNYGNAHYPASSYVGLQVAMPLFNGLRNGAQVKKAELAKQQSKASAEYQYEQLHALSQQAVSNVKESMARLKTAETVRETAKLSYEITEYRYSNGIASRLELTDAELAYSTAQSNYLEAVYDYLSSKILLERLTGKVE